MKKNIYLILWIFFITLLLVCTIFAIVVKDFGLIIGSVLCWAYTIAYAIAGMRSTNAD